MLREFCRTRALVSIEYCRLFVQHSRMFAYLRPMSGLTLARVTA